MMPAGLAASSRTSHKLPQAAQQNAAGIAEARRGVHALLSTDEQLYCQWVESIVHLLIEHRPRRLQAALSFDFKRARAELRPSNPLNFDFRRSAPPNPSVR